MIIMDISAFIIYLRALALLFHHHFYVEYY